MSVQKQPALEQSHTRNHGSSAYTQSMSREEIETPDFEPEIQNQLFNQLKTLLLTHPYPELRLLSVKTDEAKLYVVGYLSTYYLKQILVATTRCIRNHIQVEYDIDVKGNYENPS